LFEQVEREHGRLDVLVSSAAGEDPVMSVKFSHKALAMIWASELRNYRIAAVAITPGFLRSERMLENFGVTEENWRDAGAIWRER